MYGLYLAIALYAAYTIIVTVPMHRQDKLAGRRGNLTPNVMVPMIVLLFTLLFGNLLGDRIIPAKQVVSQSRTLVSLNSANSVSGTFVWGTGSIGGSSSYEVYVQNADGSKSPYSIFRSPLVRIFEEDNLKDTGTWTEFKHVADEDSTAAKWFFSRPYFHTDRIELHVPRGTVRQDFKAN